MKKFNLERALAGSPVITRDGIKVTQIYCERNCSINNPVNGFVEGKGWKSFDVDGKYGDYYHYDLFMAPPVKKERWCLVLQDPKTGYEYLDETIYTHKEMAESYGKDLSKYFDKTVVGVAKVEWKA